MRRKVDQVRLIVDKELGFVPSEDDDRHHSLNTFLYIVDKRVVGMASAEPITEAYILSDNNRERTTRHKAMVGIHQLWVHGKFRKRGIATRLVDTVRERMVFGVIVPSEQVAFSSPTVAGACFARQYLLEMSSKNSVLVYDCR